MTTAEIVRLMNREDRKVAVAVGRELPTIARAVDAIVRGDSRGRAIDLCGGGIERKNGGAGCGGVSADVRDFSETDACVYCGRKARVTASGGRRGGFGGEWRAGFAADKVDEARTWWWESRRAGQHRTCWERLSYARKRGAMTVAVTSNRRMAATRLAKIAIATEVGPEVLTGSTRLKAGTSQKMVLNMLSTAVMVRLGHVYENLMIDVVMTNEEVAGAGGEDLDGGEREECVCSGRRFAGRGTQHASGFGDVEVGSRSEGGESTIKKGAREFAGGTGRVKNNYTQIAEDAEGTEKSGWINF